MSYPNKFIGNPYVITSIAIDFQINVYERIESIPAIWQKPNHIGALFFQKRENVSLFITSDYLTRLM